MQQYEHTAYLGLGCNLGNRQETLARALKGVSDFGEVVSVSKTYESLSWGYEDNHAYLNLVCCIVTFLTPEELHKETLEVEVSLGRETKKRKEGEPYRPRLIDIDILFYDDLVLKNEELTIPHSQLHLRNFVLKPMMDIAKDHFHPVLKKSMIQLYSDSPDKSKLQELKV
ncbi:MAG: 2-amino-4-hydroxy-6-hydroxymethyldihydropteridine diphosphokinase [Bacteroidota bacterium]